MSQARELRILVLGPVEVLVGSVRIRIAGHRQRLILALLALRAGHTVSVSELIAAVWDEDPPETARRQVQNGVSQLRAALAEHGLDGLLRSEPDGYRLQIFAEQVDAGRFQATVTEARSLAADGNIKDAIRALREALALWRGPALAGLTGDTATRQAARLAENRLGALEECLELEQAGGAGRELIEELSALMAENPLRERLAGMLMVALNRDGRQAEALRIYHAVAAALAEQLGVDPGPDLMRRYEAILRNETGVAPGPAVLAGQRPAQLPAATAGFTGRLRELDLLDTFLGEGNAPVVISGTPGVGKTTLAVQWAHRVRERFPDGQLYVNMRGFDPTGAALTAADAIRGFLDVLGAPPERIPVSVDGQAVLYRTLLDGKRMLMLVDNAHDAEQIRPLLPGASGCLALVTSRTQLTGLVATAGAHALTLDLMSTMEARELLARRLGAGWVDAEPGQVEQIIAACARLPLALSIVAARAGQTGFPLATIAGELHDGGRRLDALDGGDPASQVRTVFSWSYAALSAPAARLFRLLGLNPGPDLSMPAVASLAALPEPRVRPLLSELTRASLLAEHLPGRYSFHDLLRAYAADLVDTNDTEQERAGAVRRLLDHYTHTAHAAAVLLDPLRDFDPVGEPSSGVVPEPLSSHAQALAWFTAERVAVVQAVAQAAERGYDTHAFHLALTMADFLERQGHWPEWLATQHTALRAGVHLHDQRGQARVHRSLARVNTLMTRMETAADHLHQALDLYRMAGDRVGQAYTLGGLSTLKEVQGDYRQALQHAREALVIFQAENHLAGEGLTFAQIGWVHSCLGEHEEAIAYCRQALVVQRHIGHRAAEASTLDTLGYVHHNLGHTSQAVSYFRQAEDLFHELGDQYQRARTMTYLGETYEAAGDPAAAGEVWRQAATILDDLGHPDAATVRAKLLQP